MLKGAGRTDRRRFVLNVSYNTIEVSWLMVAPGIIACKFGLDGERCVTDTPAPNITMTARFFQRQATVTAARSNFSITNVDTMTKPVPVINIDLPAYRAALGWLLDFRAANIPAPSSIAEIFWTDSNALRDPSYHAVLTQNFQGILAFPFWLFNANNYGNPALQAETVISTLPQSFIPRRRS